MILPLFSDLCDTNSTKIVGVWCISWKRVTWYLTTKKEKSVSLYYIIIMGGVEKYSDSTHQKVAFLCNTG